MPNRRRCPRSGAPAPAKTSGKWHGGCYLYKMGMKHILLLMAFVISLPSRAEDPPPTVFDQMRIGGDTQGVIKGYERNGTQLTVEIETTNALGIKQTTKQQVCDTLDTSATEVWRAQAIAKQEASLKEAKASEKPVSYQSQGPWSPCVKLTGP